MDDNDIERLKNISNRLRSKIIGQDQAVINGFTCNSPKIPCWV